MTVEHADFSPVRTRERLPNRRQLTRYELTAGRDGQQNIVVDVGFAPNGRPMEVFISGQAAGSELGAVAQDAATLISLALQFGVPVADLAKSIGRIPAIPTASLELGEVTRPASLIGAVLDLLAQVAESGRPLI